MEMPLKTKIIIGTLALIIAASGVWFFMSRDDMKAKRSEEVRRQVEQPEGKAIVNEGNVSPISGIMCDSWDKRAIAVMQPGDVPARPAAGFSQADMVIEMPVITASVTRLMGIYICELPTEVGSMRSARHDFIHLAKGLDAIFVPWGRSESHSDNDPVGLAQGILDRNEVDNINCNQDAGTSAGKCSVSPCFRKEGMSRGVDSGYSRPADIVACAKELGYRNTSEFEGYPHQEEAGMDDRGEDGWNLRVGYAGPFAVDYTYDRESNTYLRTWGDVVDTDRLSGERLAPKNVVVMFADSEQIEGQYNNVQLGDPWYDTKDSGEAYYYMNGKQYRGTWKKDKGDIASKLQFFDASGAEIAFVPGQIWVEILEPGQGHKWRATERSAEASAQTVG